MAPQPSPSYSGYAVSAAMPRGRFHSATSRPQQFIGGIIGVVGGAVLGGIAGRVLGGDVEMALGMAIGAGLGLITGATVGQSARLGAERTYRGDPIDLLGHGLVDEQGQRIGRVVSVYLDDDPQPVYLGIATTWMPFTMPHLVPWSALSPVLDSRALQICTTARVVRTAPTFALDATIYSTDEEEIAQHYAPHGIRDRRWWRSLAAMSQPPVGERRRRLRASPQAVDIVPEAASVPALPEDELDVAITLGFSGDAPFAAHAEKNDHAQTVQEATDRSQSAGPARPHRAQKPPVAYPARRNGVQPDQP